MNEKEVFKKIQLLKQIEPNPNWVGWNRINLLGDVKKPGLAEQILEIFQVFPNVAFEYKPVLVSVALLGLLTGTFGFAQAALPGDWLYPVKRMTEKASYLFVAKNKQSEVQLGLANKRLEELTRIAKNNQVRNLALAINEFRDSANEAAKNIMPSDGSPKLTREIVKETGKLKENKGKVEALGVAVGETKELNEALSQLVEREIKDLEGRTLSENQQELLKKVKLAFEQEDFSQALETILLLSYPQP